MALRKLFEPHWGHHVVHYVLIVALIAVVVLLLFGVIFPEGALRIDS